MSAVTKKKADSVLSQLVKTEAGIVNNKPADFVEATLLRKGQKVAYFDLGNFGTGVLYGVEFVNASSAIKHLKVGDTVSAKVIELETPEGFIEVSLAEAGKQKVWEEVRELKDAENTVKVTISGANSGGLLTEINGIKAFLPVSQLANENYPRVPDGDKEKILSELQKFVGQTLTVKIINSNQVMNKLIVSEREVADEGVKKILDKYKVDDIVTGEISGVASFGAFVKFADEPSIEGLIHISEIDHRLIENPKDAVTVGEKVKAKIVEIKDGRVSLSLKALKPNPWDGVAKKYKEGQKIEGTITRFNPFGAFVSLDPEIQGLIHVTEFGGIEEMKEKVALDKSYEFIIDSIKPEEKRIILKLAKKS